MSAQLDEAFSLRTYPYSETHKIAVFLTRESGIVRAVAYGSRGSKSRFGSSLEPLTQVRLTVRRREGQDLATIQNCEIIRPFPDFQPDWEQTVYFAYFVELLSEFGQEQQPSERLFRLVAAVLSAASSIPIAFLARYLELWILQIEGILPTLESRMSEDLSRQARSMMRLHPRDLSSIPMSPESLNQLSSFCEGLIERHLEKHLKSRRMIDDLT